MSTAVTFAPAGTSVAELANRLKALGDENRLRLMVCVAETDSADGACLCDLAPQTNLAQSTVSHHMKVLVEAGLLTRTQRGKSAIFALTPAGSDLLVGLGVRDE